MKIRQKMWLIQAFSMIWPGDRVYDLKWPRFKLIPATSKAIILTKSMKIWQKNVTSRVLTSFYDDLTKWPSFWPGLTHIRPFIKTIILTKFHEDWTKINQLTHGSQSLNTRVSRVHSLNDNVFSSPEHEMLKVSYWGGSNVRRPSCVVHQQLLC